MDSAAKKQPVFCLELLMSGRSVHLNKLPATGHH